MNRLIVIILSVLAFLPAGADGSGSSQTPKDPPPVEIPMNPQRPVGPSPQRPRMPAADYAGITAIYCDGAVYIDFDESEGWAVVEIATFEGDLLTSAAGATASTIVVPFGYCSGTFRIVVSTSEGSYEGWFSL